jgi:hypothetical protein|tara:strand:+ start:671 stop:1621 length:951 start_codon:yes stop_codon:yes gene_type:complete
MATARTDFMYPNSLHSVGSNDWIEFNAFRGGVAGYTKSYTNTKNRQTIEAGNSTSADSRSSMGNAGQTGNLANSSTSATGGTGTSGTQTHEGCAQLYIPEKLAMQSKSNYEGTAGGTITSLASNRADNMNFGDGGMGFDGFGDVGTIIGQVTGGIKDLAQSGLEQSEAFQVGAQATGAAVGSANRHVLFKGIEFRTFSYVYQFLPKSQEESTMIRDMIRWFRSQMLPSLSQGGNKFHVPNWFTIDYKIDGESTEYLNKIKPCVCTACDVEYGGDGQFAMLQADNFQIGSAAPAVIGLTLEFQEVQLVTRSDALAGY